MWYALCALVHDLSNIGKLDTNGHSALWRQIGPTSLQTSIVQTTMADPTYHRSLSSSEKRFCSNTLNALMKHERSLAFLQPVDPVLLNIPDYFDIIKRPMDLSTIQRKLQNGEYHTVDDFCADVRLMFDNCHLYNNPGDPVTLDAKELERTFNQCLAKRKAAVRPRI